MITIHFLTQNSHTFQMNTHDRCLCVLWQQPTLHPPVMEKGLIHSHP